MCIRDRAFAWPLQISMSEHEAFPLWRQLAAVVLVALIARVWVQPLFSKKETQSVTAEQI